MQDPTKGDNTGLIDKVAESDYVAGTATAIKYEERMSKPDWSKYQPTDEWQRRNVKNKLGYDTYSCVTFSALNIVEMQVKYLIDTKQLSDEQVKWLEDNGYIDENDYPNFNDWFTAVMSGTTEDGNYKTAVWDSIRKDGLLPQNEGYQVNDFTTRSEYLTTKPTEEQKEKAKKILDILDIKYEWVVLGEVTDWSIVEMHLKHAPLHISTPTCSSWNNKNVSDCGVKTTNHATTYIEQKANKFHGILDHYEPFVKNLDWDYYVAFPLKGVVTAKEKVVEPEPVVEKFTRDLTNGKTGEDVKELQVWLNNNGFPVAESGIGSKGNETSYYGRLTRNAVARFQEAHKIKPSVGFFGPITRKKLNSIING